MMHGEGETPMMRVLSAPTVLGSLIAVAFALASAPLARAAEPLNGTYIGYLDGGLGTRNDVS